MARNRRRWSRSSRKIQEGINRAGFGVLLLFALIGAIGMVRAVGARLSNAKDEAGKESVEISSPAQPDISGYVCSEPVISEQLLTPNEYSRAQLPLRQVRGIVVHYTGNPGASAQDNRDYFENLKDTHLTKASSHYIIGLSGEIIRCIPENEMSYASNNRNSDTISIECCHSTEGGQFNDKTYGALIQLTSYLIGKYGLNMDAVIRHYDVTGKNCPKFYVENPAAWEAFLSDVSAYILKNGEKQ